jgi:hypothetical protein
MAAVAATTFSAERLDKLIGIMMGGDEDRWWMIKMRWITDMCTFISAGFRDWSKVAIYGGHIVLYLSGDTSGSANTSDYPCEHLG